MNIEAFSKHLQIARQNKGLTQKQLADKLGVTAQAVSKWERGIGLPDVAAVGSIAEILECSADYLYGLTPAQKDLSDPDSVERKTAIERAVQGYPISFRFGIGCTELLKKAAAEGWSELHAMRLRMAEYGIMVPLIGIRDVEYLKPEEYQIVLYRREIQAKDNRGTFTKEMLADTATPDMLVPVFSMLARFLVAQYDKVLNRQMVTDLVNIVRSKYPAAVDGVIPEKISLSLLQRVLGLMVVKYNKSIENPLKIIEFLEDRMPHNDADALAQALICELAPRDIIAG